jgi:tRNA threonylcarbamoyladenosine biosynthesis protein TsaB
MNDIKPVLAIETSDILCSACLYFSEEKIYSASILLKNSHSEKLFSLIEYLLDQTGLTADSLSTIAVSEGPGSFTGLRIGMSAAKGIAAGAGLSVTPVPTFEAFAYQISQYLNEGSSFIISNKVNKDEVYYAKFQVNGNNYIFTDNLIILNNDDFIQKSKNMKIFGNALSLLRGAISTTYLQSAPSAEFIARWAVMFGEKRKTFNYDYLEPNYLKNFLIKEKKK